MIYEVHENGERIDIQDSEFELQESSAYLLVSSEDKRCYIWVGENSGVRKQFVAASEARKIKFETSFNTCNVKHDEEQEAFESALNNWRSSLKSTPSSSTQAVVKKSKKAKGKANETEKIKAKEDDMSLEVETFNSLPPNEKQINEIMKKLETLDPIDNHVRDYIVSTGHIYNVSEIAGKLDIELLNQVKNGVFQVKNYLPRFLIEDSKLIAIELWRKTKQ
ncbi:MAG: hypothetical protein OEZ01_07000 [Candidatus Heimdallarchaeota archaeon]|nr:hypothetical protein [Candidatus Heimdallarchaeota archaeon]MDH5645738.1 hypothetical protein [Candidatus Heimdallarchaeota archaeon]